MLDLRQRSHRPWPNRATYLHLAGPLQLELGELAIGEVGGRKEEWHLAFVVLTRTVNIACTDRHRLRTDLGPNQKVPALYEMSAQIPSWLSDHLQPDVMPWHPRDLASIEHVVKGLVQIGILHDPLVRVVLPSPDRSVRPVRRGEVLISQNVLRGVPSAIASTVRVSSCHLPRRG